MDTEQRKNLSLEPIVWEGDLADDCTALWAGLMLRAECMDEEHWWWAVYDMNRSEVIVESSNRYDETFKNGKAARFKAENVAKRYINFITGNPVAKYHIAGVFKITGRGLVFAGHIEEGFISAGNIIEFTDGDELEHKRIIGVEAIIRPSLDKTNVGLLIECKNDAEIDYLRGHVLTNQDAMIFGNQS